jgi:predicted O-methyltransferase YrrM
MKALKTLKRIVVEFARTPQLLDEIREGLANQSELLNRNLQDLIGHLGNGLQDPGNIGRTDDHGSAQGGGGKPQLTVTPLEDIPYLKIDLSAPGNPVGEIVASPEFARTDRYFSDNPAAARSLVSGASQALLFNLVRNLAPHHVIEIGTFKGGTSEAIGRALHANGGGLLHTIGPFDSGIFLPFYRAWPEALRDRVRFYSVDSMAFFMRMQKNLIQPSLVFVDGNHDYEFALFDILAATRCVAPGGFVVVDNVSQAGPYYAAVDFLASHPEWLDCATRSIQWDPVKAYDGERTRILNTDLMVLRAPMAHVIGARPRCFGEVILPQPVVKGVEVRIAASKPGTLHAQCVLRGFSPTQNVEATEMTSVPIDGTGDRIFAAFAKPLALSGDFDQYRAEAWLTFIGEGYLSQSAAPKIM